MLSFDEKDDCLPLLSGKPLREISHKLEINPAKSLSVL